MTDDRVIEYLRSRGRAGPPAELVRSVMAALDATPTRSPFAAFLPAAAVAGVVALVTAVAVLLGQDPNVGPGPDASPTEAAGRAASVEELAAALSDAVDVVRQAPGVEGWQESRIRGELSSAAWFDWSPNGDWVIVQRVDVDVTQTGWWMDPAGEPPATGRNVATQIWVTVGNEFYAADELAGGTDGWSVTDRQEAPRAVAFGTGILDGAMEPWELGLLVDPHHLDDARVTRLDHRDGGSTWTLETPYRDGRGYQTWTIAGDGGLRSWTWEVVGASPDPEGSPFANASSASLKLAPRDDAPPIQPPDIDAPPDPADFGLPGDFPLAATDAQIDYHAYVVDVLDFLEAYHWNSENVDWATARTAALDGLPEEPGAEQAHARIRRAIETFDPFGTVFVSPQDVPPDGDGGSGPEPIESPTADRIGDVGYVALPSPNALGATDLRTYLSRARLAMGAVETSAPACGWVVDLRDYDGGAWGPTMLALSGLLGDGRVVTFRSPAAEWWLEIGEEGSLSAHGFDWADDPVGSPYIQTSGHEEADEPGADVGPHLPAAASPPVAVLVGNGTVSGGEQTLAAFLGRPETRVFGAPTGGSPIVAPNYPMADGAVLRVPTWVPVDREGIPHTGNIRPDEVIGDTRPIGGDAALDAALDWLEARDGCS